MKTAATVPIEPGPYTLRELVWMSRSAMAARWDHTSTNLAMQYNIHRGRNSPARTPRDFHPLADRRIRRGMSVDALHALRDAFGNQQTITLAPGESLPEK